MKTLSLLQPYATLVVLGAKRVETRSWQTDYRGELYIHASARMPKWCRELLDREPFAQFLHDQVLPLGQVVGRVTLDGCQKTSEWLASPEFNHLEKAFGDFGPRRYAWRLSNPVPLDTTLPFKGALGLWDWYGEPDYDMTPAFFTPSPKLPLPPVPEWMMGSEQ